MWSQGLTAWSVYGLFSAISKESKRPPLNCDCVSEASEGDQTYQTPNWKSKQNYAR